MTKQKRKPKKGKKVDLGEMLKCGVCDKRYCECKERLSDCCWEKHSCH